MSEFWFTSRLGKDDRQQVRFDVERDGTVQMSVADLSSGYSKQISFSPTPDQLASMAMQALKARAEAIELLETIGPSDQ